MKEQSGVIDEQPETSSHIKPEVDIMVDSTLMYSTHGRSNLEELILSNQIGGGFRDTLSTIHDSTVNVMSSVEHNGLAGIQETARQGSTNLGATERSAGDTRASVERNGGETRAAVERNHGETRAHLDRLQIALFGEICDVRKEASDNKAEIMLDACKNTHSLTLQAAQNASDIARQVAECCCEMKELVRAENGATRDLLATQEQARLRDALADAKQSMLLLQLGGPGKS